MKNIIKISIAIVCLPLLPAMGNTVSSQVTNSVIDNKTATTQLQWMESPHHPDRLFNMWTLDADQNSSRKEVLQNEICNSMMELDTLSLTVFENQIADPKNTPLLSHCKYTLLRRIDIHHKSQKKYTWSVEVNNFKFPDNVQKRDTTNGYFAVTGDVVKKEVILTFDDGPSIYTDSILRSLEAVNAKAIFFMLGKNARANPTFVKKVANAGHAIGSHSETHSCLGDSTACERSNGRRLSFAEAAAEIRSGHQAIQNILGWVDPFFRFPYGESSDSLKKYLADNSVANFYWSIDSEDWRAQTNENLLKNVLAELDKRGRGIVLFHDIQRKTSEIMPEFLRALYFRGYSVVLLQSSDENARFNSKLVKKNVP